jgi:Rap1a immunity proteins
MSAACACCSSCHARHPLRMVRSWRLCSDAVANLGMILTASGRAMVRKLGDAMIKLALGVAMALTVLTGEARADGGRGFYDGNKLYEICISTNVYDEGVCLGYVEGVVDHMDWMRLTGPQCIPAGTEARQVRDVVINYLRDHPEDRSYTANAMVRFAVYQAWNCK